MSWLAPPNSSMAVLSQGICFDDFRLAIASTLNLRQLDEFSSVMDAITKGVNVIFVVNDSVENAVRKVKDLVG